MSNYAELPIQTRQLFDSVHAKRIAIMGADKKKQYAVDQVTKIEVNQREKCLEVHFLNGEWSKYYTNGTWG